MDFGFLKTLFFSLPVLIFVIWQLISVSRELDADKKADASASERESSNTRHTERQQ